MKSRNFIVRFFHNDGRHEGFPVGTTCKIQSVNGYLRVEATAVLYFKDTFSKAKGRKASLRKAIDKAQLIKHEREEIWNAYFENFKKV